MESMADLIDELEQARDGYDRDIAQLRAKGVRPESGLTTEQVIARVEQWRDELDRMLARYGRGKHAHRT